MNHAKIGVVIADDMEFAPLLERAKHYGLTLGRICSFESASFSFAGKEITAVRCGDGTAYRKRKALLYYQHRSFRRS